MGLRVQAGCGAEGVLRPCGEGLHGTAALWIELANILSSGDWEEAVERPPGPRKSVESPF